LIAASEIRNKVTGIQPCIFGNPNCGKLAKCPFSNNPIPVVESVLEVNWVITSSTILFDRLDNIMNAFEATHFLQYI
jgi:hypothetical protein